MNNPYRSLTDLAAPSDANWRGFVDQLTDEQIHIVEQYPEEMRDGQAKRFVTENAGQAHWNAAVTPPPDATDLSRWENLPGIRPADDTGRIFRQFKGSSWEIPVEATFGTVDHIALVGIEGRQFADGEIERWIACDPGHENLTQAAALGVAKALLFALEEIRGLEGSAK